MYCNVTRCARCCLLQHADLSCGVPVLLVTARWLVMRCARCCVLTCHAVCPCCVLQHADLSCGVPGAACYSTLTCHAVCPCCLLQHADLSCGVPGAACWLVMRCARAACYSTLTCHAVCPVLLVTARWLVFWYIFVVKVKVEFALEHVMNAQRGSTGIALLFL